LLRFPRWGGFRLANSRKDFQRGGEIEHRIANEKKLSRSKFS
jgi:hypothetical protein